MNHRYLSDRQLIEQLESGVIDPGLFSHEAHIRMAWLYFRKNGFETGLKCISKTIHRLDDKHNSGAKYHHTITVAFSLLIFFMVREGKSRSWKQFIEVNPELHFPKKLLANYYSDEILYSEVAKKTFVTPDKEAVSLQDKFFGAICFFKIPIH